VRDAPVVLPIGLRLDIKNLLSVRGHLQIREVWQVNEVHDRHRPLDLGKNEVGGRSSKHDQGYP
jgi:hypothetical protein